MATTGTRKLIGSNGLAFSLTDAGGAPALLPGFVLTDTSGNPLTPLASGGSVVTTGNVASGAADSGNPVKVGGRYNLSLPVLTDGQRGDLQLDPVGNNRSRIVARQAAGADNISNNTIAWPTPHNGADTTSGPFATGGFLYNGSTWDRAKKPSATSRITSSANSTNATVAKAGAGDLFGIQGYNTTASVVYLKLYNKASAPSVGTDTPVKTIPIPPNAPVPPGCTWANGFYFSTGIAYALTGAAADNDTTAVSAGAIVGLNLDYQ